VLHQVFYPYGVVDTIEIFPGRSRIVAFIKYGLDQDATRAFENLQGRNIYDGCCQLCIELLPVLPGSNATN
jgi:polypyrimidine tract-binding protein 2